VVHPPGPAIRGPDEDWLRTSLSLGEGPDPGLRAGADPVHAFVDGYHLGLPVTIALMAAGVVISYLALRPRAQSAGLAVEPTAEITAVGELEALGELTIPAELTPRADA
jgi:hypothetical protein